MYSSEARYGHIQLGVGYGSFTKRPDWRSNQCPMCWKRVSPGHDKGAGRWDDDNNYYCSLTCLMKSVERKDLAQGGAE